MDTYIQVVRQRLGIRTGHVVLEADLVQFSAYRQKGFAGRIHLIEGDPEKE